MLESTINSQFRKKKSTIKASNGVPAILVDISLTKLDEHSLLMLLFGNFSPLKLVGQVVEPEGHAYGCSFAIIL